MTPAQLLRKLDEPSKVCEPPPAVTSIADFAAASQLSPYACCKQKTCPICGSKGVTEKWAGHNEATTLFFYCSKSNLHVFEVDDNAGVVDRVPM